MALKKSSIISQQTTVICQKPIKILILLLTVHCLLLTFFGGCASPLHRENILAVVNNEPITEEDLIYSLQIAHRRNDLSFARTLNLTQFVKKLIDDRLIIQEARHMGMEEYPEVQQAIQSYILRESVVRLHDEEIVQKVTITEEDIVNYYKKNYERFTLGIIEVGSEEDAKELVNQLKKGGNFSNLAQKYSTHPSKKDGGEVVLTRNVIPPPIEKAISNLNPDEFSDVIPILNNYYIVKLITREEAPDEDLKGVRKGIERAIRKQRERERSDEYLKYLRERATIKVDYELLSDVELFERSEGIEELSKDERPLAEVNGSILTVGDFVAIATSNPRKSKEEILDSWIDLKIVDNEALSRHYEMEPDLENMIDRYENQLFKNTFIRRVIIPQIVISDKTLEEYYLSQQESFTKPARFKIQQITVKTIDEAQDILNNLQNGADFSWLAKKRSIDSARRKGGDIGWLSKAELPEPIMKIVDTLTPGDISPVIKINAQYRIIRLQDRREEEVEEFTKVKNDVYRAFFNEQINTLLSKYVSQLKTDAEITINDDLVQSLEERFQK